MLISIQMKEMKRWIVILVFLKSATISFGQQDTTIQLSFESKLLLSTNQATPLWLTHNKFGIYEGKANEFILQVDVEKKFQFGKKFCLDIGSNLIGKSQFDKSYIQEIYSNLSYGKLKLILGKEEITYTQYSDNMSTGSYYFSNNARPIPRIGIGFYEYTDLPFTKGYVQIKGFINQAIFLDDRTSSGTNKPLFHEKIAYIRTNKLPVNFHLGLNHSALFGGTLPNGKKIPVDYWATFFGLGSSIIGGGEETNAAGGHLGLFDFGIRTRVNGSKLLIYGQKPFKDTSGFTRFFENNKDHIIGFVLNLKENDAFLKEIVYENISLLWHSGEGLPDLVINGKTYLGPELDDKDKIMWEEYGIETDNISDEDFWRFVTREENFGNKYGGRDNYYNNGLYKRGWSYWGKAIGNPLLLTERHINSFNPDFDSSYDFYFVSTRVFAHHIGIIGQANNFIIRSRFTYSKNYGTHRGLNKGGNNWDSKDAYSDYRYYFENGLYEVYTAFDLDYTFQKTPSLRVNLELGFDFGEMYNSFGAIIGLKYQPVFNKSKSQN